MREKEREGSLNKGRDCRAERLMGAEEWAVMAIRHGGLGITEGRETCRLGDKRSYGVLEGCLGPRRGGDGDNQTRSDCHHTTAQPPQLDIIVILSLLLAALSFSFSLSFALTQLDLSRAVPPPLLQSVI